MSDISRRLKKVENTLNVNREERPPAEIVYFGGGVLPPDTPGITYVRFEDVCKEKEQQ